MARCVVLLGLLVLAVCPAVGLQIQRTLPQNLQQLQDNAQRQLKLKMEQEISLHQCPRNCSDRGPCMSGTCICPAGYGGDDCSQVILSCPNFCSGQGICESRDDGTSFCQCKPGFTGEDCSQEAPQCPVSCSGTGCVEACSNHGVCSRGVCFCDAGWIGDQCTDHASSDDSSELTQRSRGSLVLLELFIQIPQSPSEFLRDTWDTTQHIISDALHRGSDQDVQLHRVLPRAHVLPNGERETGLSLTTFVKCSDSECLSLLEEVRRVAGSGVASRIHHSSEEVNNLQVELPIPPLNSLLIHGIKAQKIDTQSTHLIQEGGSVSCPNNCNLNGECIKEVCVCNFGWYGTECNTQDECQAGCVSPKVCASTGGHCVCPAGTTGFYCNETQCDPPNCSDHGECKSSGKCECSAGWAGDRCDIESTCSGTPLCSNHGHCAIPPNQSEQKFSCICDTGYYGQDCTVHVTCPEDCNDRGLCDVSGRCLCNQGFKGFACEHVDECPQNCSEKGDCVLGKCYCYTGYRGSDCSVRTLTPEQVASIEEGLNNTSSNNSSSNNNTCPSSCSGHGKCISGVCDCSKEWTKADCSERVISCPKRCSNVGVCRTDGTCQCPPGRMQPDCSQAPPVVDQICAHNCSGNGLCTLGSCVCAAGYGGVDCSQPLIRCLHGCSGAGHCVATNTCKCEEGFSGSWCEISPANAAASKCLNNCTGLGRCRGSVCSCYPGYTGSDCSIESWCPRNCSGKGLCINGECICLPGYGGHEQCAGANAPVDCSQVLPLCPNRCSGRGNCSDKGVCVCEPGYHGVDCSSAPLCLYNCSGNGYCVDGVCQCDHGFGGAGCNQVLRSCPSVCPEHSKCNDSICVCVDGWSGNDCSVAPTAATKCPSAHKPLECSGNGDCVEGACKCFSGFFGQDCASQCPNNCSSTDCTTRGLCLFDGSCQCLDGWAGSDCSEEHTGPQFSFKTATHALALLSQAPSMAPMMALAQVNHAIAVAVSPTPSDSPSSSPAPSPSAVEQELEQDPQSLCPNSCNGHGVCISGKCACDVEEGFGGPDCSELVRVCPNMCSGAGWCNLTTGVCVCERGFFGVDCSEGFATTPCSKNCSGLGTCRDGHCACGRETSGKECNIFCPRGCSGNGVCVHGECMCSLHYHGDDCASFQPPAQLAPAARVPTPVHHVVRHAPRPHAELRSALVHHHLDEETLVQLGSMAPDEAFEQAMKQLANADETAAAQDAAFAFHFTQVKPQHHSNKVEEVSDDVYEQMLKQSLAQ